MCEHNDLSSGKVDVREDLGQIYVDHRCNGCGDKITQVYTASGWLGGTGRAIDAPAAAE